MLHLRHYRRGLGGEGASYILELTYVVYRSSSPFTTSLFSNNLLEIPGLPSNTVKKEHKEHTNNM